MFGIFLYAAYMTMLYMHFGKYNIVADIIERP